MEANVELSRNEAYKNVIDSQFERFSLDLRLCSPRGLRLSRQKLVQLFTELEEILPPHLANLPQLNVTIQAGSTIDDPNRGEIQSTSIQIYSPHSTRLMLSYEVEISDLEFSLKIAYQRSPTEIRKASLHGESDNLDELFEASTVLTPVIFIVDDSPVTQKALSRMLRKINPSLTIRCFNDGSEVVEFYTSVDHTLSRPCTLILMDKQMPILDGLKATVQIRAYEAHFKLREIPIVAITAQSDLNESELLKSGITGFCYKPFSEASIKKVLMTHNLMPPLLDVGMCEDEDTEDKSCCRFC